jgi:membrane-associated protease RseP (regulator of RpoE activity)
MVFQSRANTQNAPIICENDIMICNAEELRLSELEDLLYQECGIRIAGLKYHAEQRITYKAKGPILESIKRLLRYLDVESYVFEFNGDQLAHVLIYSRGKSRYVQPGNNPGHSQSKNEEKTVIAVKVLDIVPGSQAEVHGFQKNDIIVEYDSVPIKSASQLVSVVKKKKKEKQRVELVLIRDGSRYSYILDSGLIGVRIQTTRVSPNDLR